MSFAIAITILMAWLVVANIVDGLAHVFCGWPRHLGWYLSTVVFFGAAWMVVVF